MHTKIISKTLFLTTLAILTFSMFSCDNDKLTEDEAKQAVNLLLAQGEKLPDNNPNPATLTEWQGLIQVSETEMHGKAKIKHDDGDMGGKFIFHKNSGGEWVIDRVEFRGDGFNSWRQEVYQKVE